MLRAVILSRTHGWDPASLLDVIDQRTLRRLLHLAGLEDRGAVPTVATFLLLQQFVHDSDNLTAVARELALAGKPLDGDSPAPHRPIYGAAVLQQAHPVLPFVGEETE